MTRKPATYDDLREVPENKVAEIIDGELYASPRPGPAHAESGSAIGGELWGPFNRGRGGPGGWRIIDEPELHLGSDVLVPDVAGWGRERMPTRPSTAFFELAPDWLCEILSPSTETLDRARKLPLYAAAGVRHAWLVNPTTRTLEVMRLEQGKWLLLATHAGDAIVRAEPFDAIELDLLDLWGETRPG